jgi:hypothetical protein
VAGAAVSGMLATPPSLSMLAQEGAHWSLGSRQVVQGLGQLLWGLAQPDNPAINPWCGEGGEVGRGVGQQGPSKPDTYAIDPRRGGGRRSGTGIDGAGR